MKELQAMKEKRIRVFKFDDWTQIKNIYFFKNRPKQINVILSNKNDIPGQYALFGDGSTNENARIFIPDRIDVYRSLFALVNDQLHIFGGWQDSRIVDILECKWQHNVIFKILKIVRCQLTTLPIRLQRRYSAGSSALSISSGKEGTKSLSILFCRYTQFTN